MAFTPVEIRHVRLGRRLRGYDREETDRLLTEVADSFEGVWRERADLADRLERLEEDLLRYRELDGLLRTTLVTAEGAAREVKDQATRAADLIVGEARIEASSIVREARAERDLLLTESRRIRSLLRSALDALPEHEEPVDELREGTAEDLREEHRAA